MEDKNGNNEYKQIIKNIELEKNNNDEDDENESKYQINVELYQGYILD